MSYPYFNRLAQVLSWGRYLVENGICTERDFTFQKMVSAAKLRENKNKSVRDNAYIHAAALADKHPTEYITWCTLQRITGKRGAE